ncbi:MAG: hypothetical protein H6740_07105 [Alphaproteobacteria bacterium]|nr:hypothetical protein [Alphaproteobacteria bacterium]
MSIARKLAFSLVTVLLVLIGVEGALRAMGWPTVEDGAQFSHRQVYWKTDPNLDDEPMLHKELGSSFPVSTNADGLRTAHGQEKPDGVFRVMAMGCSTTFGWGVADAETYPDRLEGLLRARGHAQVEVINAGQPGYTTFQGRWLWDEVLADYKPDLVLVGYIVQDARKAAYSDLSQAVLTQDPGFLRRNLLYRSKLFLGLRVLTGGLLVRTKERAEGGEAGVYRVSPESYVENLRALAASISEVGAEPVFFGFPLEVEGYTEFHRIVLRTTAEDIGIPHFDPSAQVTAAARSERLYFEKDRGHPNAAGHALIAELVAGWLHDNDLIRD